MGLWDAPPDVIAEQLRHLTHTLRSDALADCRAGLESLGDGHLPAAMSAAYDGYLAAVGGVEGCEGVLVPVRARCHDAAHAAEGWRKALVRRLERDEAAGVPGVARLRRRLRLRRVKSVRLVGMLTLLRDVLPELRGAGLPDGVACIEPIFLAAGAAHVEALDAREEERDRAERALGRARVERERARQHGREVSELLIADAEVLRTGHGIPCQGIDLRVLQRFHEERAARVARAARKTAAGVPG